MDPLEQGINTNTGLSYPCLTAGFIGEWHTKGGFFCREHLTRPPSLNEGVALTRALDQPKSPDEPTVVQTTTLT